MSTMAIEIDEARCTGCGACIRECGHGFAGAPRPGPGKVREVLPLLRGLPFPGRSRCSAGPIGAWSSRPLRRSGSKLSPPSSASRRSTRHFLPEAVPRTVLAARLFGAAAYIPSGGNRRSHRFTLLRDDRARGALMTEIKRIYRLRSFLMGQALASGPSPALRRPSGEGFSARSGVWRADSGNHFAPRCRRGSRVLCRLPSSS